jgi:CRP-like cAMP-binding protein
MGGGGALPRVPAPSRKQLVTLAIASGLPFVGFGFADNAIMILVGDKIDSTLGVRFGLSTLAAAGLGNLISDVVGISLGEVIEAWMAKIIEAPPLTVEQYNLRSTRLVKGSANAFGIALGCLIGMAPLLFIQDRKTVFFDDDEMALFHSQFAPYGVSPSQFFALLHHGKWRVAEAGTTIVASGDTLDSVFFIHSGAAHGTATDENGHTTVVSLYTGRDDTDEVAPSLSHMTRGCIIGGSALVDASLSGKKYPSTVTLTKRTKFMEWSTAELREAMREDKEVEAAVLSTLYLDLVRGIRQQREEAKRRGVEGGAPSVPESGKEKASREYEVMLRAVLADGQVHPLEKGMLQDYALKHGVADAEHNALVAAQGWTDDEWRRGRKATVGSARLRSGTTGLPPAPALVAAPGAGHADGEWPTNSSGFMDRRSLSRGDSFSKQGDAKD